MNILILGASGFIGNSIFNALQGGQHNISIASRTPIEGYKQWKHIDFSAPIAWNEILQGIDMVINAIGIIEGNFDLVQTQVPLQLYEQCIKQQIKVIHISAVGAEREQVVTPFLASKKQTDSFLLNYPRAKVVYPGVVIGKAGRSSQFFAELAELPVIPLIGHQQPPLIHINQLTQLVVGVVNNFEQYPSQIFAVAQPEPLSDLLSAMKGKKARFVHVPAGLFRVFFALFPKASVGIFDKATFAMFQSLSVADYKSQYPKASSHVRAGSIKPSDAFVQLFALLAICFIWVWSGVSSFISWDESYKLMLEVGANDFWAVVFIYLGGFADIIVGLAVWNKRYRKLVILGQISLMVVYMAILSVLAPHYWLHPFGVLSKNIPLIALSYYMYKR